MERRLQVHHTPARNGFISHITRRHKLRHYPAGLDRSWAPLSENLQDLKEGPTQRTLAVRDRQFREQTRLTAAHARRRGARGAHQNILHSLKDHQRPTGIAQYSLLVI